MEKLYKIGAVSRICGVPAHVIRYYEELGLITSQRVNGTTTRYYDPFVFEQLTNIRTLRKLDFSIEEIQTMMADNSMLDPFSNYRVWENKQNELRRKINDLQENIQKLEQMKKGDFFWQMAKDRVQTIEMPEVYFYPQTKGDHAPLEDSETIMDDVFETVLPNIRKIGFVYKEAGSYSVQFGFGIERNILSRLNDEQQKRFNVIPAGEYYVKSDMIGNETSITDEYTAPLYEEAVKDGYSTSGTMFFELGYGGHILLFLQKN